MKIDKVLIAEDFESITVSVRKTLADLNISPMHSVQYCDDALLQLRKALVQDPFQLLITDLSFVENKQRPQSIKNGEALIKAARDLQPGLKVIVFSGTVNPYDIGRLYDHLKIDAYVPKGRRDAQKLRAAIEAIQQGRQYLDPELSPGSRQRNGHDFTAYDLVLLQQLLAGKTQKEISEHLRVNNIFPISQRSIEQRLKIIRESYGFASNIQLVVYCKERGII